MRSFSTFILSVLAATGFLITPSSASEASVEYQLQAKFREDKIDLYLQLAPSSTIDGLVLYQHSEEKNPYQNIPLTPISVEVGQAERVFLISFRADLLESHPMTLKLLVADPEDPELSKAKELYSLIASDEPNIERREMLKSEFARRTEPWAFREETIMAKGNRSERKRVTIGGTILRSDSSLTQVDSPNRTDYTISGSMSLDKHGRGLAIIKLPQGAND